MDKKAVFYLIISSLFITIMVVVFIAYKEYAYVDKQKVIESRVRTINDFIRSIDIDSKRTIYISGFRALVSLEDQIATTGEFVNSTSDAFQELFINGTLDGESAFLMENNTFTYWVGKIGEQAGEIGLNLCWRCCN